MIPYVIILISEWKCSVSSYWIGFQAWKQNLNQEMQEGEFNARKQLQRYWKSEKQEYEVTWSLTTARNLRLQRRRQDPAAQWELEP